MAARGPAVVRISAKNILDPKNTIGNPRPMQSATDPFHVPPHVFCAGSSKRILPMPAPHAHSQVELNFLLQGGMTYLFGARSARVRAGDFVFFWGAAPHQAVEVEPDSGFICIYVPIDRFLSLPLGTHLVAAVLAGGLVAALQPQPLDAAQLQRLHAELVGPDRRLIELDRAELEHMLRRVDLTGWRDLLGDHAADGDGSRHAAHQRAIGMARFIIAHAARPIGVADVAASAGLHPNYAMTLFRQAMAMTIGDFLLRQRLQRAQALLTGTHEDVASVAYAAGFGSLSRFHQAFARQFGTSPRRFRAQHIPA